MRKEELSMRVLPAEESTEITLCKMTLEIKSLKVWPSRLWSDCGMLR